MLCLNMNLTILLYKNSDPYERNFISLRTPLLFGPKMDISPRNPLLLNFSDINLVFSLILKYAIIIFIYLPSLFKLS